VIKVPQSAGWRDHPRYPDPAIQALDVSFEKYMVFSAAVERLYTGCRWSEGPVYFGDGRYLLWSDIPNNRILKWEEETNVVSDYRRPSNFGNGQTRDRQGRLITCEHIGRVVRTEYDGSQTVIMDKWKDKPLNSPNDVIVRSDGSIWFTDPPFGLLGNYEGNKRQQELPQAVYRVDGDTLDVTLINDDIPGPNGLAFSPDEKTLYIVASRGEPHRSILAFDVSEDGHEIANKRIFIDAGPEGTPDGFRVDIDGNLWCGWGMGSAELDGVLVFAPDGNKIGRIQLPERCANVCFGGPKRNRLFMAASQSLYSLYVNTQGVAGG